jgi:hypothetical protein
MAVERDWLILDQPERDWLILEPQPCSGCLELRAEVERFRAALERANRERRGLFAEVFRLEVLRARIGPRTGKRRSKSKPKPESVKRQARRTENNTAGAPDPLRWFLQRLAVPPVGVAVVKGGEARRGLLRDLCKKRGGHLKMSF